jgi:sporulation protein YlmC with PRC-barrel domain
MPSIDQLKPFLGNQVLDRDGDKVGKLVDLYVDDDSNEPKWFAVKTGLFGNKVSFVPIARSHAEGDDVQVAHLKDQIKDAPRVDPDGALSPDEERQPYRHCGLEGGTGVGDRESGTRGADDDAERAGTGTERQRVGRRDIGEDDDAAAGGPVREASGGVRLRKYVVTEEKTITVPVQREVVEVVDDDDDNAAR